MKPNLAVEIAGIKMKNPVMPASGTFGYGEEFCQYFNLSELGAVVTKGTTLNPREGNPQPRIMETASGMINFIGLQNPGLDAVINEKIPFLRKFNAPVIVNFVGRTSTEFGAVARRLNEVEGVAGLEVNISCPNIEEGGMAFGTNPKATEGVVAAVRQATSLPVIVKLTPNVTDIKTIALSAVGAGADAFSLINTVKGRAYIRNGPDKGRWIVGGLSGPCIKPIALQKIAEVVMADLETPVIGIGGIRDFNDALDFFRLGVAAIQVGTANFVDIMTMPKIIKEMEAYMEENEMPDFRTFQRKIS